MKVIYCSSCLLGKRCLYHGFQATFALPILASLRTDGFKIVDACPEMLGGLPCPRPPSRVENGRVTQRGGSQDVTLAFETGAKIALEVLNSADPIVALLLLNSPACDPTFGIFGTQAAAILPVIACKRGTGWEARLNTILRNIPQFKLFQ